MMKKTSTDREKKLQLHKETLTAVVAGNSATVTIWTCPTEGTGAYFDKARC